ncbi:MAG: hypothetical protein V1911_01680 [Candidatus Micrarchaeota archaeon]
MSKVPIDVRKIRRETMSTSLKRRVLLTKAEGVKEQLKSAAGKGVTTIKILDKEINIRQAEKILDTCCETIKNPNGTGKLSEVEEAVNKFKAALFSR